MEAEALVVEVLVELAAAHGRHCFGPLSLPRRAAPRGRKEVGATASPSWTRKERGPAVILAIFGRQCEAVYIKAPRPTQHLRNKGIPHLLPVPARTP